MQDPDVPARPPAPEPVSLLARVQQLRSDPRVAVALVALAVIAGRRRLGAHEQWRGGATTGRRRSRERDDRRLRLGPDVDFDRIGHARARTRGARRRCSAVERCRRASRGGTGP